MTSEQRIAAGINDLNIELPSWAFGNSGTRFKVFPQPGVPRDPYEKIADAAQVNLYTGSAPSVALHIPWIASTTTTASPSTRPSWACVSARSTPTCSRTTTTCWAPSPTRMSASGARRSTISSSASTSWTPRARATSSCGSPTARTIPGQDDIVARQERFASALAEVYARLGEGQRMLLEYKLFEPSFYTTDVPDWGTAYVHCSELGDKAQVVIDTGHHAPGTNIEFIVAMLLRAGKLGGFDFNSRFYADDDLMVGAADPFQLFRIMWEVRRGGGLDPRTGVAFMLDQCHNIEPKIAGQIRSVMNVQEATAKALLIDHQALTTAQLDGDVLGAHAVFMDAYATDVRQLLAEVRAGAGSRP